MNFLLLQITAKLSKKSVNLVRVIFASCVGGVYSLIILCDELPSYIILLSKIIVAILMVFVAFSFHRVSSFVKTAIVFFFSSLVLLGIVVGIYLITKTNMIAINNSAIYLNISARSLLVSAFFAYIIACLFVRIYNHSLSKSEIYSVEITNNGKMIKLNALVDTGNKLREPFSNCPVIVVDREKGEKLVGNSTIRYVPTKTVSGEALLTAFKPEKIVIKADSESEIIENAYVALSNDVNIDGFSAVINPEVLSV